MNRAARVVIPDPGWVPANSSELAGQAMPLDWDATLRTIHHGPSGHDRRAAVPNASAARARIRSLAWTLPRREARSIRPPSNLVATSDHHIEPEKPNADPTITA
jgi:hypothetical protein